MVLPITDKVGNEMNGIEKITARLCADAQAEIDALNAETDAACALITKEYEEKAAEVYARRMNRGKADCETRVERLGAAADMAERKAILAFKQDMVSEAFEKAIAEIIAMPKADYVAFLAAQAAKAAVYGTEELALNAHDREELGKDVLKAANALMAKRGVHGGMSLAEDAADIRGGVIVRQGNIEINCSVETLVLLQRSELASQVANILFS